MIKNLNDLLSLIVLTIMFLFSIRLAIWAFTSKEKKVYTNENIWQLIKDYNDNEEE